MGLLASCLNKADTVMMEKYCYSAVFQLYNNIVTTAKLLGQPCIISQIFSSRSLQIINESVLCFKAIDNLENPVGKR